MAEVKTLSKKQIQNRLQKYFNANHLEYDQTANFHPYSSENSWVYDIGELGKTITLTCDEHSGKVSETQVNFIQEQKQENNYDDYEVVNPMKMGM